MSNIFYHSDWHFNHEFVAETRGFASAAEHDDWLITNINSVVGKRDHIWMLGDLNMGSLSRALPLVNNVNGTKHLVLGNHDAAHPMHSRSHTHLRRYLEVFDTVSLHEQHDFGGVKVKLSHFPYFGDHKEVDRYSDWRLRDTGQYLLHGHVHKEWAISGRQINVGVDFHPTPVSRQEAAQMIEELSRVNPPRPRAE